jgi:hypothetical protein
VNVRTVFATLVVVASLVTMPPVYAFGGERSPGDDLEGDGNRLERKREWRERRRGFWQWERGRDWREDDYPPHRWYYGPPAVWQDRWRFQDPWEMHDRCMYWHADPVWCYRFAPGTRYRMW